MQPVISDVAIRNQRRYFEFLLGHLRRERTPIDAQDLDQLLAELGLIRIEAAELAFRRIRRGKGFCYLDASGSMVRADRHRDRIRGLVIPPAWDEVRIAEDPQAHLQAVGRDEAGRLQYLYHPDWETVRTASKVERLRRFGSALPRVRSEIAGILEQPQPTRELALAAALGLVDRELLRAGHEMYAGPEGGRGVATLLKRHVRLHKGLIAISFRGKGGKQIEKVFEDQALAGAIELLKSLKGRRLFQYMNSVALRPITANDLNQFLREIGHAAVSVKDFRTFFASSRALALLAAAPWPQFSTARRKRVGMAMREVSVALANTPTVVRKSYVLPAIIEAYEAEQGLPAKLLRAPLRRGLNAAETALMRYLDRVSR